MPYYITSPFKPTPQLMVPGTPAYLLGKFNDKTSPTLGSVLSDSASGTTSTVTVKILSGNIPVVDSLISIVGSTNSGGGFNVVNAPITAVSSPANPDEGIYVIQFTNSSLTQTTTSDTGQFIVPQPEVGESLTVTGAAQSSAPVVAPVWNVSGKSLSATIKLPASTTTNPSTLTGVTVLLQGANFDLDSEYNTIATVATGVAAGSTTDWQSGQGDTATGTLAAGSVNFLNFRFYRFQIGTAGSGTGPIIGKLLQ